MCVQIGGGCENRAAHLEIESVRGQNSQIRVGGQSLGIEVGRPQTSGMHHTHHVGSHFIQSQNHKIPQFSIFFFSLTDSLLGV